MVDANLLRNCILTRIKSDVEWLAKLYLWDGIERLELKPVYRTRFVSYNIEWLVIVYLSLTSRGPCSFTALTISISVILSKLTRDTHIFNVAEAENCHSHLTRLRHHHPLSRS